MLVENFLHLFTFFLQFHRTLNMIGIAATICGFVCIFVANDWEWTGPKPTQSGEMVSECAENVTFSSFENWPFSSNHINFELIQLIRKNLSSNLFVLTLRV